MNEDEATEAALRYFCQVYAGHPAKIVPSYPTVLKCRRIRMEIRSELAWIVAVRLTR